MVKNLVFASVFILLNFGCKQEKRLDAQIIIDKSIKISGGDIIKSSTIEFDFRDKHYKAVRENGKFVLERSFSDKSNKYFDTITQITDAINNKGFMRLVNNFPMAVTDTMATKYSASVNSVHYFSVLPYGLNDKAVKRTFTGETQIKGKSYYKIKITFSEDGGGEDFEDVFMYWINTETLKADYLAYSYEEDDGTGLRFREAYNERFIEGIRFVDYNNYKPKNTDVALEHLGLKFENDELELLSKIELKNIEVSLN